MDKTQTSSSVQSTVFKVCTLYMAIKCVQCLHNLLQNISLAFLDNPNLIYKDSQNIIYIIIVYHITGSVNHITVPIIYFHKAILPDKYLPYQDEYNYPIIWNYYQELQHPRPRIPLLPNLQLQTLPSIRHIFQSSPCPIFSP